VTYDRVADLPLTVESYELEGLGRQVVGRSERRTTVFHLCGSGEEGLGEDVTWASKTSVSSRSSGRCSRSPGSGR
jgi:hypothetical protein